MYYLIVRAKFSLALLSIVGNNVAHSHTMNIDDNLISADNQITAFECPVKEIRQESEKKILIGTQKGYIYYYDFITYQLHSIFGGYNSEGPFRNSSVNEIKMIPGKSQFFALYADSTLIRYDLNQTTYKLVKSHFIQDVLEIQKNISFYQNWNYIIHTTALKPNNIQFYGEPVKYSKFQVQSVDEPCFQYYVVDNVLDSDQNVISFFKFDVSHITSISLLNIDDLSQNNNYHSNNPVNQQPYHLFFKLALKAKLNVKITRMIFLMFTSNDGYFRVIELNSRRPIFSFKTEFAGINSSSCHQHLISLSCQNDMTIIFNTSNLRYFTIEGQTSFISKALFMPIDEQVMRVVSSSYDGSIGFTDFTGKDLEEEKEEDSQNESESKVAMGQKEETIKEKVPLNINFLESQIKKQLNPDHIQYLNYQGIGYLNIKNNILATSSFDGCVSIFQFSKEEQNEEMLKKSAIKNKFNGENEGKTDSEKQIVKYNPEDEPPPEPKMPPN